MHTEEQARHDRVQKSIARRGRLTLVPDLIAGSAIFHRNFPIPKGKELFPIEWKMQYVDLFYPEAKGENGERAPVYIDLPTTTHDVALCERKMATLKSRGMRYTYIKAGEGEWEGRMRLEGSDPDKIKADQQALARGRGKKSEVTQ